MASSNPGIFKLRLVQFIQVLLNQPHIAFGIGWDGRLRSRSAEQWAEDVSRITVPKAKWIFGADSPPSVQDLLDLPMIPSDNRPGVYLGVVLTPNDVDDSHSYVGSATAPGRGLMNRTGQHADPNHRKKEKQKRSSRGTRFYNIVDQADKNRYIEFRALAIHDITSGKAAVINYMRETCLVAEQIFASWLRSFTDHSMKAYRWLESTSPWKSGLSGLNGALPLGRQMVQANRDSAFTEEALREIRRIREADRIAAETVEERQHRKEVRQNWQTTVRAPVYRMRKEGRSDEEIVAFKKRVIKPKTGKKIVFDTATERPLEERLAEAKAREKREAQWAEKRKEVPSSQEACRPAKKSRKK
ncbi:hypothetical protein K431DRAFT_346175 [Polychaeton citri CBS 116435]|uniref:Uncharacterized protein n=1 Tax=Polychaeton citri CBS 116435 TaxID=1314669 RepID=A0A9P4UQE1_9PEZI|nr:hypothetical protein K431DRAFT_346175 [Polychaeton citri CBS 116435]